MPEQTPTSTPVAESLPDGGPEPQDLDVTYVGGGSRDWAVQLMSDLALCPDLSGTVTLYDVDVEGARRNATFGNEIVDEDADAVSNWTYTVETELGPALEGADFVMMSTQFPIPDTHVKDLEITKEHGIYDPVAVTIGPAGVSWNMRTIPQYREFARAIEAHCPDAWVLNYSNPMTHLTRTLYKEFPGINAIGLCHEVRAVKEGLLGELVAEYYDVDQPSEDEIHVNVAGVNHFTWIDEATWQGRDLLSVLDHHLEREGVIQSLSEDQAHGEAPVESVIPADPEKQATYELYRRFGVLPAVGDRHLVEYAPWFLQGEMPADLNQWGVVRTTAADRLEHWNDGPDRIQHWLDGEDSFELEASNEEMVDIMQALLGIKDYTINANLPNRGQMADLPTDAIVETNAVLGTDRVTPLVAGSLTREVRNLVERHVNNQETLVEAAFEGDVDKAYRAFFSDPQIMTLQPQAAKDLFGDLVAEHREYLDDWDLEASTVLRESNCYP